MPALSEYPIQVAEMQFEKAGRQLRLFLLDN